MFSSVIAAIALGLSSSEIAQVNASIVDSGDGQFELLLSNSSSSDITAYLVRVRQIRDNRVVLTHYEALDSSLFPKVDEKLLAGRKRLIPLNTKKLAIGNTLTAEILGVAFGSAKPVGVNEGTQFISIRRQRIAEYWTATAARIDLIRSSSRADFDALCVETDRDLTSLGESKASSHFEAMNNAAVAAEMRALLETLRINDSSGNDSRRRLLNAVAGSLKSRLSRIQSE